MPLKALIVLWKRIGSSLNSTLISRTLSLREMALMTFLTCEPGRSVLHACFSAITSMTAVSAFLLSRIAAFGFGVGSSDVGFIAISGSMSRVGSEIGSGTADGSSAGKSSSKGRSSGTAFTACPVASTGSATGAASSAGSVVASAGSATIGEAAYSAAGSSMTGEMSMSWMEMSIGVSSKAGI